MNRRNTAADTPQGGELSVSVIVASQNARNSIAACLSALEAQQQRDNGGSATARTDIIVVDNSSDGTDEIVRRQFPGVRLIRAADTLLIPQLWERGIQESHGAIAALTTAHGVPRADWLERIRAAHAAAAVSDPGCVGLGGAIENAEQGGAVDWAVYFCRYAAFLPPFAAGKRTEIAADNASYARWALDRVELARRDGFWEPKVHAALRAECGGHLTVDPEIVVTHHHSFGFAAFLGQRFRHGLQYGRDRMQSPSATVAARFLRIATGPVLPLLLVSRAARLIFSKGPYASRFVRVLPILCAFFAAWSLGEWLGYCLPAAVRSRAGGRSEPRGSAGEISTTPFLEK